MIGKNENMAKVKLQVKQLLKQMEEKNGK